MNEQLTRQTYEMFSVMQEGRIPETLQAIAEGTLVKTRQGYASMSAMTRECAKVAEEAVLVTHANARAIGAKVFKYSVANAEAAFDTAQAIARAKTIPEAVTLQASYLQRQLATGGEQMKDLFELSAKLAREAFDSLNASGVKGFEHFKKLC